MDDQRSFIGKKIFYSQLQRFGSQRFLRRNLTRALDSHERDLVRENSNVSGTEGGVICESGRQHFEWKPWSMAEMEHILRSPLAAPMLKISSLHLRKAGRPRTQTRPNAREECDWLPDPATSITPCQIVVTVVKTGTGSSEPIYSELRQGCIVGLDNSSDNNGAGDHSFDIELERSFDISRDQLAHQCANTRSPPQQLDENCALEIAIQFQDSNASEGFIHQLLGNSTKNDGGSSRTTGGIVRASWSNLLQLPRDGQLLHLRKYKRGNESSILLEYGVEVIMGWSEGPSPLERHNRSLVQFAEHHNHMPTPVSEDLESNRVRRRIKYLWRQGSSFEVHSHVKDDYRCILCQRELEQTSFNRLLRHYKVHHDHFRFEVAERSSGLTIVRIHHAGGENESHGTDWQWQAPRSAFDIDAHVGGDTSWTDLPAGRGSWEGLEGPYGPSRQKKPARILPPKTQTSKQLKTVPKRKFTEPEDVEDLGPRRRQKHRVPAVEGVQFYRTTSKQKLVPGSYVYDSDDDVDDDWLKQSQRRDLRELGQDHISVDFHELFNRHLDEEQPMSDTLTSDTVVRFARKYADILQNPRWREKFEAKLTQFETRGVIRKETVEYCKGLLEAAEKNASRPSTRDGGKENTAPPSQAAAGVFSSGMSGPQHPSYSGKVRVRWINGKMRYTDEKGLPLPNGLDVIVNAPDTNAAGKRPLHQIDQASQQPASQPRPLTGPCVCGNKIEGKRGTIACANPKCLAYGFHMSCVGLESRPMEWRCTECSA